MLAPEHKAKRVPVDTDDAGVFFVGSPTLEAADIVACARDNSPLRTLDFAVDQLHDRASQYADDVFGHVHTITGLAPKLITGYDALQHALGQDPDLSKLPAVLMAPQTFEMRYQSEVIRDQVNALRGIEAVNWEAPVAEIPTSGIIYHGLAESIDSTKVGSTGRKEPHRAAFERLRESFEPYDSEGVVLIDDRATNNYDYLIAMARPFVMKGIAIRAYIVGHSAGEQYADASGRTLKKAPGVAENGKVQPGQVPIYSFAFRYANEEDRMFGRGNPADEFADLGYFGNSGHSIIRDYLGRDLPKERSQAAALPILRQALGLLEEISRSPQESFSRSDFDVLNDIGVSINNPDRLVQVFESNARMNRAFTVNDLHELLRDRGRETVLTIPGLPGFNPDVLEGFRAPMLWPGTPEERSFIDWISSEHRGEKGREEAYGRWSAFSALMLHTTRDYLADIEEITGTQVPASVLGLHGVPKLMELFSVDTRQSDRAVDHVEELIELAQRTNLGNAGSSAGLAAALRYAKRTEQPTGITSLRPREWW